MPTERFYRLPKAKQELIREAAVAEFARVPYEKVSINQIIHSAEISRGSFYTYFEDKDDLLGYVFSDSCEQIQQFCETELEKNGGDYFNLLERMYDHFVDTLQKTTVMMEIVRNVFSYRESAQILGIGPEGPRKPTGREEDNAPVNWLLERIDCSRFRYETPEEYEPLMMLGTATLMLAVKRFYQFPKDAELVRRSFLDALELLKHGAYQ